MMPALQRDRGAPPARNSSWRFPGYQFSISKIPLIAPLHPFLTKKRFCNICLFCFLDSCLGDPFQSIFVPRDVYRSSLEQVILNLQDISSREDVHSWRKNLMYFKLWRWFSRRGCRFLWCSNPMSARPNSPRKTDQSTHNQAETPSNRETRQQLKTGKYLT